jgi:hypothetical protein
MAHGFKNYTQPFLHVNLTALGNNCYFCTVAALSGMNTHQLVGKAEEMQDDIPKGMPYILGLFGSAGQANVQHWSGTTPQQVIQAVLTLGLDIGEAIGLAYKRNDGSGHMVVLRRLFKDLDCLDYQANFNLVPDGQSNAQGNSMGDAPRYLPFPPENDLIEYNLFYVN